MHNITTKTNTLMLFKTEMLLIKIKVYITNNIRQYYYEKNNKHALQINSFLLNETKNI